MALAGAPFTELAAPVPARVKTRAEVRSTALSLLVSVNTSTGALLVAGLGVRGPGPLLLAFKAAARFGA